RLVRTGADGAPHELASVRRRWIDRVASGPGGAAACASGRQVWAVAGGRTAGFEEGSAVGGLAFAPKGLRLAAARPNGVTMRYVGTDAPATNLEWKGGHSGVTFSPDGTWVVTAMQ